MLKYGCTRLEIGVQSVYEDVARDTNRYLGVAYALRYNPLATETFTHRDAPIWHQEQTEHNYHLTMIYYIHDVYYSHYLVV